MQLLKVHLEELGFLDCMKAIQRATNIINHLLSNQVRLRYEPLHEKIYSLLAVQGAFNDILAERAVPTVNESSTQGVTFKILDEHLLQVAENWDSRYNRPGIPSTDFFSAWMDKSEMCRNQLGQIVHETNL